MNKTFRQFREGTTLVGTNCYSERADAEAVAKMLGLSGAFPVKLEGTIWWMPGKNYQEFRSRLFQSDPSVTPKTGINELFDKPAKWTFTAKNNNRWKAAFNTKSGSHYMVKILGGQGSYDIVFWMTPETMNDIEDKTGRSFSGSMGVLGTGEQYEVLATVVAFLKEFISEMKPQQLSFSADTSEKSRVKAYDKMMSLIKDIPGYMVERHAENTYAHYNIIKIDHAQE